MKKTFKRKWAFSVTLKRALEDKRYKRFLINLIKRTLKTITASGIIRQEEETDLINIIRIRIEELTKE